MHTFLKSRVNAPAPLVVDADQNVTFAALVDVLYTAGKAGVSSYYLEVPTSQGPRVLSVSPPRYSSATPPRLQANPDERDQPALRVGVIVGEYALHVATRPSQTEPPRYDDPGLACQTNTQSSAGPQRTAQQLCAATDGAPIQIAFSGLQDTSYGALADAIINMRPPCGATQVIEANGRTLEPTENSTCDEALANVRIPRVR